MSTCKYFSMSVCQYFCLLVPVCLSVSVSIHQFVFLSVCLPICTSVTKSMTLYNGIYNVDAMKVDDDGKMSRQNNDINGDKDDINKDDPLTRFQSLPCSLKSHCL